MAKVQEGTGHDRFLQMKNSAYYFPYNLASECYLHGLRDKKL